MLKMTNHEFQMILAQSGKHALKKIIEIIKMLNELEQKVTDIELDNTPNPDVDNK